MSKVTDFLIDNSDKMDKKVQVAQQVLINDLIPSFDCSSTFGMRTFKGVVGNAIIIKQLDLKEKNDKTAFLEKAGKMPMASGECPLALALKESMEELNSRDEETKKIILITAGEDDCGGVPEYEVEKSAQGVQINIIGMGMNATAMADAEKIAQMTGGAFCNIASEDFNDAQAIQSLVAPIVEAMKSEKAVAPKPQPVATPVVEEKKETKEEKPNVQNTAAQNKPSAAAPKVAETKIELPKVSNLQSANAIQTATVAKSEATEFDAVGEMKQTSETAQEQLSNAIAAIQNELSILNNSIPSLLNMDMQTVQKLIKSNEATAQENKALRNAEENNIKSIEELKTINEEATGTISQLMQVIEDQRQTEAANKKIVEDLTAEKQKAEDVIAQLNQTIAQKDAEIKALEENKVSMQAAIDELIGKLSSLRQ